MKIGIITLPFDFNYGGILQAYALQKVLKDEGHDPVFLNKVYGVRCDLSRYCYRHLIGVLRQYFIIYPRLMYLKYIRRQKFIVVNGRRKEERETKIVQQHTDAFIDAHMRKIDVRNFYSLKERDFDALIVGSDQIWRPTSAIDIDSAYFSFARNWHVRRIAYAVSFGVDRWVYSLRDTKTCRRLAGLFDAVSVREDSGVGLCREHLGVDAVHVLDPTLLLDRMDYEDLVAKSGVPQPDGDILVYILDESPEKEALIGRISEKSNYRPFKVNSRAENMSAPLQERIQPPVECWLAGFMQAKMVITDSFHACVFSIIFNKPFIAIGNRRRGLSRFKSLFKLFGLEDRLILDPERYDAIPSSLPENVKEILAGLKSRSRNYLIQNLK